ncbi:MAG: hypothetical protein ABI603_11510 [Acidobacteriota bacterium]
MFVAAAVAAHVWVVPGFHAARSIPGSSVLTAGASLAPRSPVAFAVLDAAAPARGTVRVRTALVDVGNVGALASPDASSSRTRAVPVDTAPSRAVRPEATAGAVRYRAVSLEEADSGTEPAAPVQMPLGRRQADEPPETTTGASPAEPVTTTGALGLSEAHLVAASTAAAPAGRLVSSPAAPDRAAALRREEEIVREVLREYAQAFERLDVQAAKALWPTVDDRALQRAFQQLDGQQLRFASCGVSVSGRDANARCRGDATYRPKVGSRTLRLTSREWTFNLSRDNDRWQIVNATLQ